MLFRSDLAVLADHGDALDVDAGKQHGAFAQDHHAVERDALADGAVDDVFGVARDRNCCIIKKIF